MASDVEQKLTAEVSSLRKENEMLKDALESTQGQLRHIRECNSILPQGEAIGELRLG